MRTIGIELEYADVKPKTLKEHLPEGWETLGDSSIQNSDNSWSRLGELDVLGAEIRTTRGNPLRWYTEDMLSDIVDCVESWGGIVNESCGMHIHIGTFERSRENILPVAEYFCRNPVAGRAGTSAKRRKRQCAPIDLELLNDFRSMNINQLEELMVAFPVKHNFYRQREVNALSLLKTGTIEYRMFASTLNVQQIIAAIDWCLELTNACFSNVPIPLPKGPLPPPLE